MTIAPVDRMTPGFFRRRFGDPLAKIVAPLLRSKRMGVLYTTRRDGSWRSTALGVWPRDDRRFLVALFGDTWWVKDIRAGRPVELSVGGVRRSIRAEELRGEAGADFWVWYAGAYRGPASRYAGASPAPDAAEAARLAAERPVFEVLRTPET